MNKSSTVSYILTTVPNLLFERFTKMVSLEMVVPYKTSEEKMFRLLLFRLSKNLHRQLALFVQYPTILVPFMLWIHIFNARINKKWIGNSARYRLRYWQNSQIRTCTYQKDINKWIWFNTRVFYTKDVAGCRLIYHQKGSIVIHRFMLLVSHV